MTYSRFLFLILLFCCVHSANSQQTEYRYLSGKGLGDTVTWDFYCSDGMNSGKWSKIEVPSQWELQGFGEYTYGRWYKVPGVKHPSMETGTYMRDFFISKDDIDKSIRLVFDGVMTDTEVFVNGTSVGDKHLGGFYRFSYDITPFVKYGELNKLEVRVNKHSENKSVNAAERKADWWLFGGIYRPVWLEIKPERSIHHMAVDANASGQLNAQVELSTPCDGYKLAATIQPIGSDKKEKIHIQPISNDSKLQQLTAQWSDIKTWDVENPNLYLLTVSLLDDKGKEIHCYQQRIGFRTVEFRPRDGIYINDTKVLLKGINRHTFHPDGGRTTNKEISIQDVLLLKEMNMNAVRFHYPPDTHFLEACDSLGIFVIDELAGWQNSYDTTVGKQLVKEMVQRDVNHPSIIIWSNGNEGGWNEELDNDFAEYDPQNRHVIHPWADFNELDTHHYPCYLTGVGRFNNGHKVFMPTEFMHGMYDQGHGAGLEDFWNRYTAHPLFAGGFMWAFCDEAVRRTDRNGELDSDGSNAPDGIVGPYREREGSFYSVREIWSPIYIEPLWITPSFKGKFRVSNRYLYTNLGDCSMKYRVYRLPSPLTNEGSKVIAEGVVQMPALSPGETGFATFPFAASYLEGDVLELEAFDKNNQSVCTRTFPIKYVPEYIKREQANSAKSSKTKSAQVMENDTTVTLYNSQLSVVFNKKDGTISTINNLKKKKEVSLNNGPLPVGMKMTLSGIKTRMDGDNAVLCVNYKGAVDSIVWTLSPSGLLSMDAVLLNRASGGGGFDDAFLDENILNLGFTFSYPEDECIGMKWLGRGPYRVWKNRIPGTNYGIWQKDYNNTITGESTDYLVYPEFKGYHANLYWATIQSKESPFTVYAASDGIFFRVFTPQEPVGRLTNSMPKFPEGDISFLLDIPAIQSFKPIHQQGPQSQPGNIRIKKGDEGLKLSLIFDFTSPVN